MMDLSDGIEAWAARTAALDLTGIAWDDVARHPLPDDARRVLRYVQDVEAHTVADLRALLATRAVDDPDVATFLACWFYEETFHGRALARFLTAAGDAPLGRPRLRLPLRERVGDALVRAVARAWPAFVAVHMTWGAINEATTLVAYERLATRAGHPVLRELIARIRRQEARHFGFYRAEAVRRLAEPRTARVARGLVDRFWAPVGSGVEPGAEVRFLAGYLFAGADGLAAARRVDDAIRRLPGFADVALLERWLVRAGIQPASRTVPTSARGAYQRSRVVGASAAPAAAGLRASV
jgi:hypothetical protein